MENYSHVREFCKTLEYQTWQNQWQPPIRGVTWFNEQGDLYDNWNTPREIIWHRTASRIPYYLLDTIDIDKKKCVDIGCGGNFLSWSNPNIWGVDPNSHFKHEKFTSTWYVDNYEKWDKVISMNANHFCPAQKIGESLSDIENILTLGGTGVVTLNRARIYDANPDTYRDELVIEQISTISTVTRVIWFDEPYDEYLDGNVWIWINK